MYLNVLLCWRPPVIPSPSWYSKCHSYLRGWLDHWVLCGVVQEVNLETAGMTAEMMGAMKTSATAIHGVQKKMSVLSQDANLLLTRPRFFLLDACIVAVLPCQHLCPWPFCSQYRCVDRACLHPCPAGTSTTWTRRWMRSTSRQRT